MHAYTLEQHLDRVREKLARDSGLPGTPTQSAIAAVVVPALGAATDKWAKALTSAVEPIAACLTSLSQQVVRLSDEVRTTGGEGLKVAVRVQRLVAMARESAPSLHRRYLDKEV